MEFSSSWVDLCFLDAWLPGDKARRIQMQMQKDLDLDGVCELIKIRLFLLFQRVGGVASEKGLLARRPSSFLVAIYWLCLPWHLLHGAASFNYAFASLFFAPKRCLISGGISGKSRSPTPLLPPAKDIPAPPSHRGLITFHPFRASVSLLFHLLLSSRCRRCLSIFNFLIRYPCALYSLFSIFFFFNFFPGACVGKG